MEKNEKIKQAKKIKAELLEEISKLCCQAEETMKALAQEG